MIKCPRCDKANTKKEYSCLECGLPLKPHKLLQYASNINMQWDRMEEDKNTLLYEDSKMRLFPPSQIDEEQSKRIVYYKNQRFVLLGFVNIIHGKKAVIHFKVRPEKGMILFYKREHRLSDLFMNILEGFAASLDWELKDLTKILDHHTNLENEVDQVGKSLDAIK